MVPATAQAGIAAVSIGAAAAGVTDPIALTGAGGAGSTSAVGAGLAAAVAVSGAGGAERLAWRGTGGADAPGALTRLTGLACWAALAAANHATWAARALTGETDVTGVRTALRAADHAAGTVRALAGQTDIAGIRAALGGADDAAGAIRRTSFPHPDKPTQPGRDPAAQELDELTPGARRGDEASERVELHVIHTSPPDRLP